MKNKIIIGFIVFFVVIIAVILYKNFYKKTGWQRFGKKSYIFLPAKFISKNVVEIWVKYNIIGNKIPKFVLGDLKFDEILKVLKQNKKNDFKKLQIDHIEGETNLISKSQIEKDKLKVKQDEIAIKKRIANINKIAKQTKYAIFLFRFNCSDNTYNTNEVKFFSKKNDKIFDLNLQGIYWYNISPIGNFYKIFKIACNN